MNFKSRLRCHIRQIEENPVRWGGDMWWDFKHWFRDTVWAPVRYINLTVRKRRICVSCGGSGVKTKWGTDMRCDLCNGRGWLGKGTWLGRW